MLVVVSVLIKLQVHSGGGDSGRSCTQPGMQNPFQVGGAGAHM